MQGNVMVDLSKLEYHVDRIKAVLDAATLHFLKYPAPIAYSVVEGLLVEYQKVWQELDEAKQLVRFNERHPQG
mgnify:CR=1 FL=1